MTKNDGYVVDVIIVVLSKGYVRVRARGVKGKGKRGSEGRAVATSSRAAAEDNV